VDLHSSLDYQPGAVIQVGPAQMFAMHWPIMHRARHTGVTRPEPERRFTQR
jgi:hypothetical protein